MIKKKEMENLYGLMVNYMKDNGSMELKMVQVDLHGQMEIFMKEIGKMVKKKEMEN